MNTEAMLLHLSSKCMMFYYLRETVSRFIGTRYLVRFRRGFNDNTERRVRKNIGRSALVVKDLFEFQP